MDVKIIGRKQEQETLKELFNSGKPEFVAIYGRRRIGKTFLIRKMFQNDLTFDLTGLAKSNTLKQLINFSQSLNRSFSTNYEAPKHWLQAFEMLISALSVSDSKRKILFIDEISWLDIPRSDFLSALEHFWNGWACARNDIMLIICGSSTSWIVNKIINDHGGLHNRITANIYLKPFSLRECEIYLQHNGIDLSRMQIAELYMIVGGIPYYLSFVKKGMSLAQNIDKIFFSEEALLKNEFENLYASLFKNSEEYVAVVSALSTKNKGLTRQEILNVLKIKSGSKITTILKNLEYCGFIRSYYALKKKERGRLYQLVDSYTLFFFNFLKGRTLVDDNYWTNSVNQPKHNSWAGYSFEILALQHLSEIKKCLGISGIQSGAYSWISEDQTKGCQIDLLIDRIDGIINLCEIKYSTEAYSISKEYEDNLRNKISVFRSETKTRKAIHLVMLTTFGVIQNRYSGLVQKEVLLDDLFANS
jgi:AAA+ ATPase superfamily predicted ATPase